MLSYICAGENNWKSAENNNRVKRFRKYLCTNRSYGSTEVKKGLNKVLEVLSSNFKILSPNKMFFFDFNKLKVGKYT